MARTSLRVPLLGPWCHWGGSDRMTSEATHWEYYQLRAMLEWDLADRAPDLSRRDLHRVEAEKYQLLAKSAKQGMKKSKMD